MKLRHTLSLLALTPACGEVAAPDEPGRPIAVLEGTLTAAAPIEVEGGFGLAMLWGSEEVVGYAVAGQSAEVEPVFPAGFRLSLNELPPASALMTRETMRLEAAGDVCSDHLWSLSERDADKALVVECANRILPLALAGCAETSADDEPPCRKLAEKLSRVDEQWPADARASLGRLVAFDDVNGNGRLDLIPPGGATSPDRLLWQDTEHNYVWYEGPEMAELPLTQGLSVLKTHCPEGEEAPCDLLVPRGEPLALVMDGAPVEERMMCSEITGGRGSAGAFIYDVDVEGDIPGGGTCGEGGLVYDLPETCGPARGQTGPCGDWNCRQTTYAVEDPAAPAAGWPCEIER